MTRKYFPLFITSVLLLVNFVAVLSLKSQEALLIDTPSITLREEPSTEGDGFVTLEQGEMVQVIKRKDNWVRVRRQDQTAGWLPQWALEPDAANMNQELSAHILLSASLYAEPSMRSNVIETLEVDQYVPINYESLGWMQVEYHGKIGYIQTQNTAIIARDTVPRSMSNSFVADDSEQAPLDEESTDHQIVVMRQDGQAFFEAPDLYADVLYYTDNGEQFTFINSVEDAAGNEFYLVQNDNNFRGYVEARVTSFETASNQHVGVATARNIQEAVIVIDAGHGGSDPGAISSDDVTYEKEATLATAFHLQRILENMGATVHLTRSSDVDVSLEERAIMSNDLEADAFLSLHYDAIDDPEQSGTTTYYFHEQDYLLAQAVNQHLIDGPLMNHGIHFGNFYVLRENYRPSLLLELAYMTNTNDLEHIRSDQYLQDIASLIANGLQQYFESLE